MTPEKVVATTASEATVLSVYLAVQGAFQGAQFVGERDGSTLGLGAMLGVAALCTWRISGGMRSKKRWAHDAFGLILWAMAFFSLCFLAWALFIPRGGGNRDFAEAQAFARLVLSIAAVPWLGVLGYQIWRLRRPDVRALLS